MRWLTGAEITSVSAQVQRDPATGNEVSTMALLSLQQRRHGDLVGILGRAGARLPAQRLRARGSPGETGNLDLDAYGELRLGRGGDWKVVAEQEPIDWKGQGMLSPVRMKAYQAQHQEFIDSILEDRTPSVTGEDGRAAVEVAQAAYRSAAEGRTIQLGAREAAR